MMHTVKSICPNKRRTLKLIRQDQALMKIMNTEEQEQQERNGISKVDQKIYKVSIFTKKFNIFNRTS